MGSQEIQSFQTQSSNNMLNFLKKYWMLIAIVLLVVVFAFKPIKNFVQSKTAKSPTPKETVASKAGIVTFTA